MKKNSKKGSAAPILIILLLIALIIGFLVLRLHWREFKVRAGFTATIIFILVILIVILILYVRYLFRKRSWERDKVALKDKDE